MASQQQVLMLALTVVLLALPSLSYGETLHVRPTSSNTSCPTHPCQTLYEYAQYFGQYFNDSNLTLLFLSGNHTLSVNLTITNVNQLQILRNSSAVLPVKVVCSSRVGFTFSNISEVSIGGLAFVACTSSHVTHSDHFTYYGLHLQVVQKAEIIDCTFQGSYGSALGVVDSRVILRGRNSFLNNCRLCKLDGGCYYQSAHTCYGGAIFVQRSILIITGSTTFSGNSAHNGGGVYAQYSSNVNISGNTTFSDNSARQYGGGVFAQVSSIAISGNTIFGNNSAIAYGGGVFAYSSSNVSISGNTAFIGNSAGYGGGVGALSSSNVDISGNTTFSSNSASYGGGALARSSSNMDICGNTTFIGNSARQGGGVSALRSSNVDINGNITFNGNSARLQGGGVGASSTSNVSISGNIIFNVNSAFYGGGISALGSNVNISGNIIFSGNSVSLHGGGVYAQSSSNVTISGNTTLGSNSAGWGGGVSARGSSSVAISGNTTFSGNSATNGGGVHAEDSTNMTISGNAAFSGNSASWGGGVSAQGSSNVDISGNTTFSSNSARVYGGGISAQDSSNVNISGNATFSGNSARQYGGGIYALYSNVDISGNTTFEGNLAIKEGGGVFAQVSSIEISGNTTFSRNLAIRVGGGVFAYSSSNMDISGNTTFSGNLAGYGGGGVGIRVNSNVDISGNTTFSGNYAIYGGGAFAYSNSNVDISGNTNFSSNSARYGGGVGARGSSNVNISVNSTFTSNRAEFNGGSIYALESNINFHGTSSLSGNVAQQDGGAIYADDSNLNFSANLTISSNIAQLGGGIYSDNTTFNIVGSSVFEKNVAIYYGGGIYTRRSSLTVAGNNMFIANSGEEGGGIYAIAHSTLSLGGMNTFKANRAHASGGGIWLDNCNLALKGSNHFIECVAYYEGGAMYSYAATVSVTGSNTFESNKAVTGGGVHIRWSNVSVTNSCDFKYNTAVFGGAIYTDSSTFQFSDSSTFSDNQADYTGGGTYAARSVLNFLGVSSIVANHAERDGGGMYTRDGSVVNFLGLNIYQNNSADYTGGGISAFQSTFNLDGQNIFITNKAAEGGGFYTYNCTVNFPGENTFITNFASIQGGGFTVIRGTLHLNGSTTSKNNSAVSGGVMYISASKAGIDGSNCFLNNTAESEGGAIYARNSVMELNGKDEFVANTATRKGAAIHAFSSTLIFQGSSSFVSNSAEYGGGIYSESSNLTFVHGRSSYLNNMALEGGAQYFDVNSNFSLHPTAQVHFQDNNATEFGGAIYVVDVPSRSECFFYNQSFNTETKNTQLIFVNNSAGERGSVLYGGLLGKCSFKSDKFTSVLELFNMSILQGNDDKGHSISSDPTQLCFCNTSELNCTEVSQSRSIYPGQQIEVSVIAIDQSGSAIPALIHTTVRSGHTLNLSETISYETRESCSSRNYSVTPKNRFNRLELYPSNRSGDTIYLTINITFQRCPIGFEQSHFTGECICDHRLWKYTNSCDIDRQAILRSAGRTFWLGVLYNNESLEGFIYHPYCPLDYCTRKSRYINLNNPDEQCSFNHSGLLCGKCKEELSLVLGSSQCKQCSNIYLALIIPFALAGVVFVILLFLLDLTVAVGTLHGLIFYANIVAANHHIFFPQSSNNPASIFTAWLNLDLGIQTCFYNGMDTYAKAWLEFVFPVYIWVIVGFLVYISDRSVTVTKLLGSNPVPVLATLFLLSYAKILRTIIGALSLTVLLYPRNNVVVWIHNANVSLANYIPLALVALCFLLLLFLPYTLLLLLHQWLQPKSHHYFLAWVKNSKLKAILDTYHAPYKAKHQYWMGLLLLVRCALYLIFAFNISGNDSINLLVISSTTSGLFIWLALFGKVYKIWYLNALELSFHLNLSILAVATYHVNQSGGSQAAVAYTSIGIAFLTFVGIVIYHIYLRIKSKVQYMQRSHQPMHRNGNCHRRSEKNGATSEHHVLKKMEVTPNTVTHTEVNLRELRSPLNLLDTK